MVGSGFRPRIIQIPGFNEAVFALFVFLEFS